MHTTITGFHRDEVGDWVAELACEHGQHMRHKPPWQERAWVTTEAGRQSKFGTHIDCPLCDRIAIPESAQEYQRTATFTEQDVPQGLRANHRTKVGTWARIVVERGTLEYHVRGRVHLLTPETVGIVEPERAHHVSPVGPVHFHVEFWRERQP